MQIINVTQIRKNIRAILSEIAKTKKPVAILQRSKPVAYLIDAGTFESMQQENEHNGLRRKREESLEKIVLLKNSILKSAGLQNDSTPLIRELREAGGGNE